MNEPTNLVALRDARQDAEQLLSQRYAEDLIDARELERRLDKVEGAETLAEIEEVTCDLVDPAERDQALVPASQTALADPAQVPAQRRKMAIFGEVKQAGTWLPARSNQAIAIFGSNQLDFRGAQLGPGVTTVEVQAIFGEVKILVPPGLPVEVEVSPILGEVKQDDCIAPPQGSPETPQLRVSGVAVFGSVEVREREPGESARDARRRRKAERKQLKAAQKQLR